MDGPEWETHSGLSREDFEKFTLYMNSNNPVDNRNRAIFLGFTQEGVKVAPGSLSRKRPSDFGRREGGLSKRRLGEDGHMGIHVYVGLHSYINGDVIVEDHVLVGPHCCLTSNNHLFNPASDSFRGRNQNRPIKVGAGSWLAAGVMITGGVTIGKGTLVCANAVVTKDAPAYSIIAGTPGRVVGSVNPDTGEYTWFSMVASTESSPALSRYVAAPIPIANDAVEPAKKSPSTPSSSSDGSSP